MPKILKIGQCLVEKNKISLFL